MTFIQINGKPPKNTLILFFFIRIYYGSLKPNFTYTFTLVVMEFLWLLTSVTYLTY